MTWLIWFLIILLKVYLDWIRQQGIWNSIPLHSGFVLIHRPHVILCVSGIWLEKRNSIFLNNHKINRRMLTLCFLFSSLYRGFPSCCSHRGRLCSCALHREAGKNLNSLALPDICLALVCWRKCAVQRSKPELKQESSLIFRNCGSKFVSKDKFWNKQRNT